ncbi:MAG: 2-dehydropantoate 2-reductase [Desulfobulbus sp.]|nr:MAG: 2-dehydropantoate 2-reductase [Desulfobulbus sp.]
MKITIIGSGAMGCLFGGLLAEAGADVHLLDIWEEHVQALNAYGVSISSSGEERHIPVQASTDPKKIQQTDLALIFVKHAQTAKAAQTATSLLGKHGALLTLQNGMGNAEILTEAAGKDRVICGTTAQGAMILGPGRIQHSGTGKTVIGMWEGKEHCLLHEVAAILSNASLDTSTTEDIRPVLWSKLFANVGINAITALTNIRNGELLDLPETRELVNSAVQEALEVASAYDISVSPDALEQVFNIARATAPNRSSMGQDIDSGRVTEIEAINGYILDLAEKSGISVPINKALTALIKTLQSHYE